MSNTSEVISVKLSNPANEKTYDNITVTQGIGYDGIYISLEQGDSEILIYGPCWDELKTWGDRFFNDEAEK